MGIDLGRDGREEAAAGEHGVLHVLQKSLCERLKPPPAGLASPMLWGTATHLARIFGETVDWIRHARRTYTFRFTSPEAFVDFFVREYGPTLKAFAAIDEDTRLMLAADLAALARRFDRLAEEGAIAIEGEYLESVGIRRRSPRRAPPGGRDHPRGASLREG
jgi:hypothetical protein